MKILVIGSGAFGTALATTLAKKTANVCLWVPKEELKSSIKLTKKNEKYLPGIKLSQNLDVCSNLENISKTANIILLCLPAQITKPFLEERKHFFSKNATFILCSKGIDAKSMEVQSDALRSVLPDQNYAILSGPGFADEIAQGLPTALVIAHSDIKNATLLQKLLSTKTLRLYTSVDPLGVQLGGSLKNVIAIGCGISTGLNLGESARISLMIRGFTEICTFAEKLGAQKRTLYGLSGFGDLSLTCNSHKSRNFIMGLNTTMSNFSSDDVSKKLTVEGVKTAEAVLRIAKKLTIEMPVISTISKIINKEIDPKDATEILLSRPLKME